MAGHRIGGLLAVSIAVLALAAEGAPAQMPPAIAAPGQSAVVTLHAAGAQIYDCKPGKDGKLGWVFREPIATLVLGDKTVGRHYAGPTWEYIDGSAVTGKVAATAPAATANDVPWLKLDVSAGAATERSPMSRPFSGSTQAAARSPAPAIRRAVCAASPIPRIMFSCALAADAARQRRLGPRSRGHGWRTAQRRPISLRCGCEAFWERLLSLCRSLPFWRPRPGSPPAPGFRSKDRRCQPPVTSRWLLALFFRSLSAAG